MFDEVCYSVLVGISALLVRNAAPTGRDAWLTLGDILMDLFLTLLEHVWLDSYNKRLTEVMS